MNLLNVFIIYVLSKIVHGLPWYIWLLVAFLWFYDTFTNAVDSRGIITINQNIKVLGEWLSKKLGEEGGEEIHSSGDNVQ